MSTFSLFQVRFHLGQSACCLSVTRGANLQAVNSKYVFLTVIFNMFEMKPNLIKRWGALEFEWMSSWKPICPYKCSHVHDTSCTYEFIRKVATVCNIGVKYYVFFHLISLVLRIKKAKGSRNKGKAALKTLYEYAKSILFMGFLVGFSKGALCIKNSFGLNIDGYYMASQSVLSGSSIFWEERSRQREITYFIMAKALRSLYVMLKRLGLFSFRGEEVVVHVVVMALLSYVFHHHPDTSQVQGDL